MTAFAAPSTTPAPTAELTETTVIPVSLITKLQTAVDLPTKSITVSSEATVEFHREGVTSIKKPEPKPEPKKEAPKEEAAPAPASAPAGGETAPVETPATIASEPLQVAQAPAPSGDISVEASKEFARATLASKGYGPHEFTCLDSLWERESNWNYQADNPTSDAFGIPQSLPGEKMATFGADWATNPQTQIKWGISYIEERYGTPCGAWGHSEAVGWY